MVAAAFSDYLVFVDESGDHGMARVDPDYPIFALACCLVRKSDYVEHITPALQRLKLEYWGHDEQVLHEHEIRKPNKDYSFTISHCNSVWSGLPWSYEPAGKARASRK